MSRIAVIGGAGFIGTNLVKSLVEEGNNVLVIDDFSNGKISNLAEIDCEIREFSILDKEKLKHNLIDVSSIVLLAALGSIPRSLSFPVSTVETNIMGTLNVLEVAREIGAQVVFTSSSSVFGANSELPKRELMWASPLNPYAASKLGGEGLMQGYAHSYGMQIVTFRLFNVFGPWQRPDHEYAAVLPRWISALIQRKSIDVYGDGTQSRDFTPVEVVVNVIIESIKKGFSHPKPINLSVGNRISLLEVIEKLQNFFPDFQINYLPNRKGDTLHSQSDPTYFQSLFPNIATPNFDDSLVKTIDWLRQYHFASGS